MVHRHSLTQEWDAAKAKQTLIREHLSSILGSDVVIALPTAPGAADKD